MKQWYCLFTILSCCSTSCSMQQKQVLSSRKIALVCVTLALCAAYVEAPQTYLVSNDSHVSDSHDHFMTRFDTLIQPFLATSDDSYPVAMAKMMGFIIALATLALPCYSS